MTTYNTNDIKREVRISQYLADMDIPVRAGGSRAVATWRSGAGENVSIDDGRGVWYDHVTGGGGSVIDMCMIVEGVDFAEAVRRLGERYGVNAEALEAKVERRNEARSFRGRARPPEPTFAQEPDLVPDMAAPYFGKASMDALAERSPFSVDWLPAVQTDLFLTAGWAPHEYLNLGNSDRKVRIGEIGADLRTVDGWRTVDGVPPVHFNDGNPEFDMGLASAPWWTGNQFDTIFRNPFTGEANADGSRLTSDTLEAWRYVVLEFDHMDEPGGDLPNQCAFWMGFLDDPAWRPCLFSLVYSGWKSIHGLLAVPRGADPDRLYALLEARFCSNGHTSGTDGKGRPVYQYRADPAGFIMQSGTRLAGVRRLGDVSHGRGRIQRLLYINPCLGYGWGHGR